MFGKSLRIGRIFGITLTANWSLLLLVAVMSVYLAISAGSIFVGLVVGPLAMTLLFGSILAHELGHSLVARRLGVEISEIELHLFGGAAKMRSMPKSPRDEILIAGAGPLVSFVLAGLFFVPSLFGVTAMGMLANLAFMNLLLGGFNLIPALPTDGGRILRAALSMRYGMVQATRTAVKIARVATVGLAIWFLVSGNYFGVALAVFLWFLGSQELRMVEALYGRGGSPYGFESQPSRSFGAPQVEVYDRSGRFVGIARGGIEQASGQEQSAAERWAESWSKRVEAPTFGDFSGRGSQSGRTAVKRRVVKGADGRLWVVAENSSSW